MHKIIFFILLFSGLTIYAVNQRAYALTATPTQTETVTPTAEDQAGQQLNDFKDRIASRVAQLKLVEKRGSIGVVTEVSNTQITYTGIDDEVHYADVDELTKFSSPSAKVSIGISDLTKGTRISVIGLYNKQSRRILARFVNVLGTKTISIHGAIISADAKNYTLQVISDTDNEQSIVDIEATTRSYSYTKADNLARAGFSKFKSDQHVIIFGYADLKEKNRMTGTRVIIFPDIPKNPRITALPAIAPDTTPVVSSGSGKKLTPIVK